MCWWVDAEVMEDVPACGGKGEADILGGAMSIEEFRNGVVEAEASKARAGCRGRKE